MHWSGRFALVLAFGLAGCGSSAPPITGTLTDFGAVCDDANKSKRVAVDGFLRFPDSFSGDLSVVLRLYQDGDASGSPIGVQTRFGDLTNQVAMVSDHYTDEDLKVHITADEDVGMNTKVRVSGTMYVPSSTATVDFACALETPLIEKAP